MSRSTIRALLTPSGRRALKAQRELSSSAYRAEDAAQIVVDAIRIRRAEFARLSQFSPPGGGQSAEWRDDTHGISLFDFATDFAADPKDVRFLPAIAAAVAKDEPSFKPQNWIRRTGTNELRYLPNGIPPSLRDDFS